MATDLKTQTEGVALTRFYGGADKGSCVQVTVGYGLTCSSVRLTREQAATLAADLQTFAEGKEEADYEYN